MDIGKLIKISFRKEGGYGLLNIFGLSVGMVMSLLIIWFLQYHFSFNSDIPGVEKIYRVVEKDRNDGSLTFGNPLPMAQVIRNDYPDYGQIAGLSSDSYTVIYGQITYKTKASIADANIFEILGTDILIGSKNALTEPGSSVLTHSYAQKLFGHEDPIGKTFTVETYEGKKTFAVKGIIKDPPVNSEFDSELYLSWESMNPVDWQNLWWYGGWHVLAKVKDHAQKEDLEQKINTILERHQAKFINGRYDFQLIPLKDSHFRTDIESSLATPVSSSLIWILGIIALIIIVIACINFVNLSIGLSERNTKETGICKVLGASRKSLAINFLVVTFFKTFLAMLVSLSFAAFLVAPFQRLTAMKDYGFFSNAFVWFVLLGMILISGLLSGLYPAWITSRPKALELLSNKKRIDPSQNIFRKTMIISQLSIATVLIITSLFIFKQISFLKGHDLGFNKNNLLAVNLSTLGEDENDDILEKSSIMEQEILKRGIQNGIENVAAMEAIPGASYGNNFLISDPDNLNTYSAVSVGIDENYVDALKLSLLEGRNFSKDLASDAEALLINETLKKKLGWNSIENKQLTLFSNEYKVPIIGVVEDININSLAQVVPPMIYRYKKNAYPEYMVFRLQPGRKAMALSLIKSLWENISDGKPFESFTVAEKFDAMYGEEERISKIISAFSLIAVILACFGLFAHVALSVHRRIKEIGIRKVNGARISEILTMLNKDIVIGTVISFIVACPIAYYALNKWLENFAYKTTLSWWIFAFAGVFALGIALLTVSWQSWRAATRNPVEALRHE